MFPFLPCGSLLTSSVTLFGEKPLQGIGLTDFQNVNLTAFHPVPQPTPPPASDAGRLQFAPQSQLIPFGCRNGNLNLLLIVAAQRPAHATGLQEKN